MWRPLVSNKIETYVAVSRAILALDRTEAAAYLERAIEVASRIGDEAYDRWESILQLGDRATETRPDRPDLAYRFGRCGEVIRGYLDKHFDWRATLRIVGRLSPAGGLAVVSRWRDRGVGWFNEILPDAMQPLVEDGAIDGREAAAFIGFAFPWEYETLLEPALAAAMSAGVRLEIAQGFVRYLELRLTRAMRWRKLETIASAYGALAEPFSEGRQAAERAEARFPPRDRNPSALPEAEPWTAGHWDALFGTDDLGDASGFAAVLARSGISVRLSHRETFWVEAFQRVRPGREAAFIALALEHPELTLFEVDSFLRAIPAAWRERLAVKAALKTSLQRLLAQHHTFVWHNRLYQRISVPMVAEAAGADTAPLEAGQSFQLVSLLAMILEPAQAQDALAFALGLIEAVLQPQDGDGSWTEDLRPAGDPHHALASLLWGCLAAPEAAFRWQAAHTVRRLCALESSRVLDHLVALGAGASFGPFADRRFVFYERHARLWLLIALARAALDHPAAVARYRDFILREAFESEPQVLIRHFAKAAATAMNTSGHLPLDAESADRLQRVNDLAVPSGELRSFPLGSRRASAPGVGVAPVPFRLRHGPLLV